MIGEPRSSLASFYWTHGRSQEAEALYRERLADPSLTGEGRIRAMTELVLLLDRIGSKEEALAIQEEIVKLRNAGVLDTPVARQVLANDRSQLARLEVEAGKKVEAQALINQDVRQAEAAFGKNSSEYRQAVRNLLDFARHAKDYELAEKLAREELRQAEQDSSALFQLSYILREAGKTDEADLLNKQGIDLNRSRFPVDPNETQFAQAEALALAGKPNEAVRIAKEIFECTSQSQPDRLQFGLRHLAQGLAGQHDKEAAEVASFGVLSAERCRRMDFISLTYELTDWAGFYVYFLHQPRRALELAAKAENIILECCGADSSRMEPLRQLRAEIKI